MQTFTKRITKKISKRLKRSSKPIPVVQNIDLQSAPNENIEDVSHWNPSADDNRPTTSGGPSGCVDQGLSEERASKVLITPPGAEETFGPKSASAELRDAHEAAEHMNLLGGPAISVTSATNNAPAGLAATDNFQTTYLQPLIIFDTVIEKIANVHPYAKMALGVLSAASKIILAQTERDQSVLDLLKKLSEVYTFMALDDTFGQIDSMRDIVGQIAHQTRECAHFIRDYAEITSYWKRLGKHLVSETEAMIQQYSNALDGLMQKFRNRALLDVAIFVQCAGETMDLSDIAYAKDAGLDTRKQCLPGTRTDILSQITEWIESSDDAAQRVLWLSGPAGKGKSAIAHTIAKRFKDRGRLGSCFCFDRAQVKRHENVFSSIARDLADCDPEIRRALADAVKNNISLKNSTDIFQQWEKLVMDPLKKLSASSVGPILIVIEALDESGGEKTRRDLLRILAGKLQGKGLPDITELPSNFRILVTSRPLHDIEKVFKGANHILRLSMDDIPLQVAERDIHAFVSEELKGLPEFNTDLAVLAAKADGLFEWARLACGYIKDTPAGVRKMPRFDAVVNRSAGKQKNLLYDIYQVILKEIMNRDQYDGDEYEEALAGFRSVMGQIFGAAEPLPFDSLNAMRSHFPDRRRHDDMAIIKHMGSLLSGTTNSCSAIRPLHASFRDFLTDKSSSGDFFVDVSDVQRDLAFASLRVMEHDLRFNICDLKSSYIPNREDTGLPRRIETSIPPHLSYSCRFWATHVRATDFDTELANEIRSFFVHERLLFWIEALGLLNALSLAVAARPLIAQWLNGRSGYEDVRSTVMDVQRFIQIFGGMILHSTPHLYLSALPFSPMNSTVATNFTTRFPNSLRLASGRDLNWAAVQTVIRGHIGGVTSVSFSPDGTRIASGSEDNTVRLWDAATGQQLGEPFQGHTDSVWSVSFSPDGTRIASGSLDKTVRLWDTATGQLLGEPFQGHTDSVLSASFSPDGTRITSGSEDKTVRLWDAATGQPLGELMEGHTSWVLSVSFSPDGTRIASGSLDETVRLWDAATSQPFGEPFQGHTDSVWSVSFSPDGTCIASGSLDETVRLWDAATGQPLGEPFRGHTDSVWSVSFSPDGTRITSGSLDETVRLWDVATGQQLGEPFQGHTDSVWSVSFSPDGTRIASGSYDSTVRLWDAATGQPLGKPFQGHTDSVNSVSFSPDGTRIASGSEDKTVRLWDAATGQPLGEPFQGHTNSVLSVSFSPDGTRIASGSLDKTVRLWDAATGQSFGEPFRGHTSWVLSVSFSPDGTRIASGSLDETVRLWDAATGQPLGEPFQGHTSSVNSVSFSPDGTRIASGSYDSTVRLWDAATGQSLGEPFQGHTDSVWSVSFSPDGTHIASGSEDKTVRLWDAATGQPLGEPFQGHTDSVLSVSFSPDGNHIVSGSEDKTVRLWDAATGQPLGEPFQGHASLVKSVSFSPDGTCIASGAEDNTVRLRDAAEPFHEFTEPPSSTRTLDMTPCTQESLCPVISDTWNNHSICFSSTLGHALGNPAGLLEGTPYQDSDSTPFLLAADGWMVGPNRRLLFWVPPASRYAFYSPGTAMVIPRGHVELDLSQMEHGTRWSNCRDARTPQ